MSARVIARGTWLTPSRYGSGEGAQIGQLPVGERAIRLLPAGCVEPLRPACPSCRPIAAGELRVHEVDDAPPGVALRLVPEPGAAGRDAALRRHAGHLGEDEPGAAERAAAVVHEVPVVGRPSFAEYCAIGDTTTRFASVSPRRRNGRNIGARGGVVRVRALRQPSLVVRDELAVAELQVVVADALAAGQQAVRELARRQAR